MTPETKPEAALWWVTVLFTLYLIGVPVTYGYTYHHVYNPREYSEYDRTCSSLFTGVAWPAWLVFHVARKAFEPQKP